MRAGRRCGWCENFFVKNDSDPPKTQFSDRPFEFYLPAGAVVEGSAALGPGGMPVQASPVPLGDPNHYAFIFPIRPGETRFQITYRLPYSGSVKLAPQLMMPTDTVAIMMPKSMTFKARAIGAVHAGERRGERHRRMWRAACSPSQPLEFTVSGTGQLPRDAGQAATAGASGDAGQAQGAGSAAADTRPGGGLGNPIDPEGANDPWAKYKWWILGGLGLVLAAGAGVLLRRSPEAVGGAGRGVGSRGGATDPQGGTLAALKEELFALETDRLQGRVTEAEYAEHKAALEAVLRRVLARNGAAADVRA